MHQGRMAIVLYQRSTLLTKIKWLYSYIVLKQGRDDSTLSSLRAYNQSAPTTKTVVRIYSCATLFYTYLVNITRYVYLSSCAV